MSNKDWEDMTSEQFDEVFFGSPVKRAGFVKVKKNILYLSE